MYIYKQIVIIILVKKTLFALFILCVLFAMPFAGHHKFLVHASQQPNPYARIIKASTFLYASPNSLSTSKLFLLPESYFVELLAPEVDGFYLAKYMEVTGYVAKTDIRFIAGTPAVPYASNASFRVFAQYGLTIRSTPRESEGISNKLGVLGYLENNVQLYGTIEGDEAVPFRGNTWLYCKYMPAQGLPVFGYVYAGFCDMVSTIPVNHEQVQYTDAPVFPSSGTNHETSGELFGKLSLQQQVVVLCLLSIPAFIIIYLLFKPSQLATGKTKKTHKMRGRLDYFELE